MAYNDPSTRYYPSNGCEGMEFQARWCERCSNDDGCTVWGDPAGQQCDILARSYFQEVDEWVYGPTREPICTAWAERLPKLAPPAPAPYRCPDTLDLFGEVKQA